MTGQSGSKESQKSLKLSWLPWAALVVSLLVPVLMLASVGEYFGSVSDLPEYYVAGKLLFEGRAAEIYRLDTFFAEQWKTFPSLGKRGVVLYIPPFSFFLLSPVALVSKELANLVWTGALCVCVILCGWLLKRLFRLNLQSALWLFAGLSMAAPVYESLRIGQIAPLLLLALLGLLLLYMRKRFWSCGVCLAVFLLKPQLALPLVLFFFATLNRRLIISFLASALVMVGISLLFPGSASMYQNYLDLASWSSTHTEYMQPQIAATVRGQLLRLPGLSGIASVVSLLILGLSCALYVILGYRLRKAPVKRVVEAVLLVVVPLGILTSLHCHDYDLMLLIPTVVAVLAAPDVPRIRLLVLLLIVPLVVPFYVELHFRYLLVEPVPLVNPLFFDLVFLCVATGVVFAKGVPVVSEEREGREK